MYRCSCPAPSGPALEIEMTCYASIISSDRSNIRALNAAAVFSSPLAKGRYPLYINHATCCQARHAASLRAIPDSVYVLSWIIYGAHCHLVLSTQVVNFIMFYVVYVIFLYFLICLFFTASYSSLLLCLF